MIPLPACFLRSKNGYIYIKADPTRGGDLGNYWHYMLGFFLPVTIWVMKNKKKISEKKLVIDSCNPLMDEHLKDYLSFIKIEYEFFNFTTKDLKTKNDFGRTYYRLISNFLQVLERKILGNKAKFFTYYQYKVKNNSLILPRWDEYLQQYGEFPPNLKKHIDSIKKQLFEFAGKNPEGETKPILLLKRSDSSKIDRIVDGKKARWFKGYGVKRRELLGVEEVLLELNKKGIQAELYEPGKHPLKDQILKFSNSSGFIGVRGAEFINMLWLPKNSKMIIFESAEFKTKAIQPALARALGLNLTILHHQGEISPKITFPLISNYLNPNT